MKLHQHQQELVEFFLSNPKKGALAWHEMGLGKTLSALAIFDKLKTPNHPYALTICPKSAVPVWRAERNKFTPHLGQHHLIMPYSQLAKHRTFLQNYYNQIGLIILDESHYIKNTGTQRLQHLIGLIASVPLTTRFLLLSATPETNGAFELFTSWALCDPTDNQTIISRLTDSNLYNKFRNSFSNPARKKITFKKNGQTRSMYKTFYKGIRNPAKLSTILKPFAHRRSLIDAKELPPKIESIIDLAVKDDHLLKGADIAKPAHYMALNERLAMAKSKYAIDWTKDFLESNHTQKLVVFFTHLAPLNTLYEKFKEHATQLTGQTTAKKREEQLDNFTHNPNTRLFLTTYLAGGMALNLQFVDTALYCGYPWTHAALIQAQARIHRQGQTNKTKHYFLVSGENDRNILNLIKSKKHATETIEGHIAPITLEDFL